MPHWTQPVAQIFKLWKITWAKLPRSKRTQSNNSSICPDNITLPNMIRTTRRRSLSSLTSLPRITKTSSRISQWISFKPTKDACQSSRLSSGTLTASTSSARLSNSITIEVIANYPNSLLSMRELCTKTSKIMMFHFFILETPFCSIKERRTGTSSWCTMS